MIEPFAKQAAEAYSRILTRYPVMDRADDAKARLIALHQPVPKPTKAAVAQNKAEEDSRKSPSTLSKLMRNFEKHPSIADAARIGEPTLVDPTPMSASDVVQQAAKAMGSSKGASDNHSVTVEVGKGEPPANQPVPRSDATATSDTGSAPETSAAAGTPATSAAAPDQNELRPNVGSSDANELKPNVPAEGAQALPPPQQVNEIQAAGQQSGNAAVAGDGGQSSDSAASSSSQQTADDATVASSKRKKKKGIHKIVPF